MEGRREVKTTQQARRGCDKVGRKEEGGEGVGALKKDKEELEIDTGKRVPWNWLRDWRERESFRRANPKLTKKGSTPKKRKEKALAKGGKKKGTDGRGGRY